ncbi:uncharacterized protein LOC141680828 [Apium graveolens]|uniref:uncharacterized protein LOC141680828 n=1 Tax=Apium graveolens TaxID=4045 RepID=UPI003D79083E
MEFPVWLISRLANQSKEKKAKMLTLCWSIWKARNDLVWSNKRWQEMRIVAKVWEYLTQWEVAQNRKVGSSIQPMFPGDGAVVWAKPQLDEVKISVDAANFENLGKSRIGIIAQGREGQFLSAQTIIYLEVMKPSLVEAIVVKEALSWAKTMN